MQNMFNEANEFVGHLIKSAAASAAGGSAHTVETGLAAELPFTPQSEANSLRK